MEDLKQKILALFFTIGVSLKTWRKIGNLDREIKPYNRLAKYFKKIYFITYGGKEELEFKKDLAENIEILPKKFSFLPSLIYALLIPFIYQRELKETDIYKTNQMAATLPAILAKWLYRKKLIIRGGYEWLSFLEKQKELKKRIRRILVYFLEKIAYKIADKIILATERDKRFVMSKFKTPSLKIKVIPNYIDTNLFRPIRVNPPNPHKSVSEKNRICYVGSLSHSKNSLNLLKAVDDLDVKLILFGQNQLGEKLKEKAKEIKKAKIELRGNIPNNRLLKELNQCNLFILPSLYEGNPKALLEAMSCGLPCIGTNVEGIKEIIKHKENGYLCETDPNSIRKAIIEVLENKNLQEKMGKHARQTILEKFSLEKNLKKEIAIYEAL